MTQENRHTEDLAEGIGHAVGVGASAGFWVGSVIIAMIGLLLFADNRIAGVLMFGSAVLCNPAFIKFAFAQAERDGKHQPSMLMFVGLSVGCFAAAIAAAL